MTWNYRIILHPSVDNDDAWYGLHEVYYDADGNPESWTEDAVRFTCNDYEGPEGIHRSLVMALHDAMLKPVLTKQGDKVVDVGHIDPRPATRGNDDEDRP